MQANLILAVNRALWGEVSRSVRSVLAKYDEKNITIRFVIDGPISDDDRESAGDVAAEVIAEFPGYMIADECIQLDAPNSIEREGWLTIFMRKE
jgi:hypothetical protein